MEKFTIIVTHYNQMNYIKTALISVLNQNYKNIELIVADDCSKTFDAKKVEEIIKKYNKNKFEYKILSGKKNVGTVKNITKALKKATGDFIMLFAGDDKLYDENVISNFIKEFKDKEKNVITSQCILYDAELSKKYYDYVISKKALKLNKKNSNSIYEKMCEGCFYGSGGTAYRKEIFDKYGVFNEEYIYVEDWAYWLYILRNGEKIYYADFNTLCHRDGGISHSEYTPETIPAHVKQYYKDILNIYVKEVLPYLNLFKTKEKYKILNQYKETILYYASFVPELIKYLETFDEARLSDKKLKYYWKWNTFKSIFHIGIFSKIKILFKYNRVVPITYITWVLFCLIIINNLDIDNINVLFLIYLITYVILYCIIYVFDKLLYSLGKIIERKKLGGK